MSASDGVKGRGLAPTGPAYDIVDYSAMAADRVRVEAYRRALAGAVTPGCTVIDLGAGTGLLGFLAAQLGAGRIIFIEPAPIAEHIAAVAAINGLANRVAVHQKPSTEVELEERADVIVSDLRGALPLACGHIEILIDARARFLRRGGRLVPRADRLIADLVVSEEPFRRQIGVWDTCSPGWDQTVFRALAAKTPSRVKLAPTDLLGRPQPLHAIDYLTVQVSHFSAEPGWSLDRPVTAYGVALWFETDLAEGAGFSSGPDGGAGIYGQIYLPWAAPVTFDPGDYLSVRLLATSTEGRYSYRWRTWIRRQTGPVQLLRG